MSTTPNKIVYAQGVRGTAATALAKVANSAFSGAGLGTLVKLLDAGPNGSLLTRLKARPVYAAGSTAFTATQAQLFKWDGANLIFDDDALVPGQTLALSAATVPGDFLYSTTNRRTLPPNWSWYVGIGVAWTPGVFFSGDVEDL